MVDQMPRTDPKGMARTERPAQTVRQGKRTGGRSYKQDTLFDLKRALELRFNKGMTFAEIGQVMGLSKQAVHHQFKTLRNFFNEPELLNAYQSRPEPLLSAAASKLLATLVDPEKLAKASINNAAYAFEKVSNQLRLEQGKSTSTATLLTLICNVDSQAWPKKDQAKKEGTVIDGTVIP